MMLRDLVPAIGASTAAALSIVAATQVLAAPRPEPGRAAVVQAISDCRKLPDRDARLACYDKAADAFEQAQNQGQVVVVDREQARAIRRQGFGFSMPSLSLFSRGPKEEPVDRVTVELTGAHRNSDGRWVMTTTDDAVWAQTAGDDPYKEPHQGSSVVIRRGTFGSYFCNVDGQFAFRCARQR